MSLNTTLERKWETDLAAFKGMVQTFIMMRNAANTVEKQLKVESEAMYFFNYLFYEDKRWEEVTALQHPHTDSVSFNRVVNKTRISMANARMKSLVDSYITYFNSQQTSLMELIGGLKRVRQKKAALDLWDREKAKWVIAEKFLNLDAVNSTLIKQPLCKVWTAQGLLTLPVQTTKEINPANIKISRGNGYIGNSDEDITTNNINPSFMFDKNPDTWFEYERLDSGPARLTLSLDLKEATVINGLSVQAVNISAGLDFEIEEITFNAGGRQTISIGERIGSGLPSDFFTVKTIGNDVWWEINFLPVFANNISIKFKQENSYNITTLSGDNRRVQRTRFPIGIKNISIFQYKYGAVGGINSSEHSLIGALYAAESTSKSFPRRDTLFSATLDLSLDSGQTWNNDVFGLNGDSPTVLMNGEESTALWRLELERNDPAFNDASSFTDEEVMLEIETEGKMVSPNQSPATFHISEKPANKEVFVLQPALSRKTDHPRRSRHGRHGGSGAIRLGRGVAASYGSFALPFSLLDQNLDPSEMHIFVNRREWTRIYDEATFDESSEYYMLNEDMDVLTFDSALPDRARISWSFDEELMFFEERTDGYYHKMETLFDPKKTNIKITKYPSRLNRWSTILPLDESVIRLGFNTLGTEYSFSGGEGMTEEPDAWDIATDRANLETLAGAAYYLDTKNGVIYLNETLVQDMADNSTSPVKLTFLHSTRRSINKEDFRISHEGITPTGVVISPDALEAISVTENITDGTLVVLDPRTQAFEARTDRFSSRPRAKTLSYRRIIAGSVVVGPELMNYDSSYPAPTEMAFIDGRSEFLGLFSMENEETVETDGDIDDLVEFKLAAGAAWHRPLGITFDDAEAFIQEYESLSDITTHGDYHIAEDGVVTVNVSNGGTLPGGIKYYYSYCDPTFDRTNRFSVDYLKGNLYTSEDMNDEEGEAQITYKVAYYKVAYDIAEEVDSYSYDAASNNVQINTENLSPINKRVKIVYGLPIETVSLKELKNYFSPLIYNVSFRFQ